MSLDGHRPARNGERFRELLLLTIEYGGAATCPSCYGLKPVRNGEDLDSRRLATFPLGTETPAGTGGGVGRLARRVAYGIETGAIKKAVCDKYFAFRKACAILSPRSGMPSTRHGFTKSTERGERVLSTSHGRRILGTSRRGNPGRVFSSPFAIPFLSDLPEENALSRPSPSDSLCAVTNIVASAVRFMSWMPPWIVDPVGFAEN
jgi:hypothetical protein